MYFSSAWSYVLGDPSNDDVLSKCNKIGGNEEAFLYEFLRNEIRASSLDDFLRFPKYYTYLELGKNKIGDEEAKVIAEALKNNHTLHTLNLENNEIGDEGGKIIGEALKNNHTLHTLYLRCKKIGDEGVKALAEALKNNHTLHTLNLYDNSIGYGRSDKKMY